ncbi:phosphopantetheine-binding protein [Streptomyces sp. NPDC002644]
MNRDHVRGVVRHHVRSVLPDLPAEAIHDDSDLAELGADSLERADIVLGVLTELHSQAQVDELRGARSIDALVDALCEDAP